MCRDYPVTGFHSQADAEHRANVTARAAWANPDALARRPATRLSRELDAWERSMATFARAEAFSAGGVYAPPTTTELDARPRVMVTSWA